MGEGGVREKHKGTRLTDIPRHECEQSPGLVALYCTPPRASVQGQHLPECLCRNEGSVRADHL